MLFYNAIINYFCPDIKTNVKYQLLFSAHYFIQVCKNNRALEEIVGGHA